MTESLAPYCMTNDDVMMVMFIMNIIGVSYVFVMNGASILERLKCMFYYENKSTPYNDRTHITKICNIVLYTQTLFYSVVITTEMLTGSGTHTASESILPLTGTFAAIFVALLLFKRVSYDAVNIILFSRHEVVEWRNRYFFTIKLLGFALAPAAIALLFFPEISFNSVKFYLLFVLAVYIYTIFNGLIKIIFTQKRNYLDIFLYLCALEFLPMGIVWKLAIQVSEFLTIKN